MAVYNIFIYFTLQRHFCVFSVNFPNLDALTTIYTSILSQHLALNHFSPSVQKYASTVISGAVTLHARVSTSFLPTAIKFHYIFNLRDLSNIFQVSYDCEFMSLGIWGDGWCMLLKVQLGTVVPLEFEKHPHSYIPTV